MPRQGVILKLSFTPVSCQGKLKVAAVAGTFVTEKRGRKLEVKRVVKPDIAADRDIPHRAGNQMKVVHSLNLGVFVVHFCALHLHYHHVLVVSLRHPQRCNVLHAQVPGPRLSNLAPRQFTLGALLRSSKAITSRATVRIREG